MTQTIWHIAKYVVPPSAAKVGSRGYFIMRELALMGHRCVMITSDSNHLANPPAFTGSHLHQKEGGVDVHWLRTRRYSGANSLGRMISWLDFEWQLFWFQKKDLPKPDAIIVSSLSLLTIVNGIMLRWKYGCRLIFEIRDIWPLTLTEEGGFSRWNPLILALGLVEWMGYRFSDAIVGTMPNLIQHVKEITGQDRPVFCIPMAIDEALVEAPLELPADYQQANIPKGKFIVCHAGTIGVSNALGTFFDCARAMRNNSNVHFLIVGDGYLKQQYQNETADLPNVSFAPAVPKLMVQAVLAQCDLVYFAVNVSKVLEYGQSLNKVIDYMLSGKPIVASYTGFASMINEAECGSFVPAENVPALQHEIERYVGMSKQSRETIGLKGRTWILKNRRYPVLAAEYLAILAPEKGVKIIGKT